MTRFVYVLPAGRLRWEVRVDLSKIIEAVAEVLYRIASPLEWESEDRGEYTYAKKWADVQFKEQWFAKARAVVDAAFPLTKERLHYRRKAHALIAARAIAIVIGGEVQPHNRRGRIQDPDSFGNDPERSVG